MWAKNTRILSTTPPPPPPRKHINIKIKSYSTRVCLLNHNTKKNSNTVHEKNMNHLGGSTHGAKRGPGLTLPRTVVVRNARPQTPPPPLR